MDDDCVVEIAHINEGGRRRADAPRPLGSAAMIIAIVVHAAGGVRCFIAQLMRYIGKIS